MNYFPLWVFDEVLNIDCGKVGIQLVLGSYFISLMGRQLVVYLCFTHMETINCIGWVLLPEPLLHLKGNYCFSPSSWEYRSLEMWVLVFQTFWRDYNERMFHSKSIFTFLPNYKWKRAMPLGELSC